MQLLVLATLTTLHRVLGTPNESVWPGVTGLPDYKTTFPQWSRQDLARVVPTLDYMGLDLLKVRSSLGRPYQELVASPFPDRRPQLTLLSVSKRWHTILRNGFLVWSFAWASLGSDLGIIAKSALRHPYFAGFEIKKV